MLQELTELLAVVPIDAGPEDYRRAIVDDNVLSKPSAKSRSRTYSYLRDRFVLDPSVPAFALLRFLWTNDEAGRPLVALLVAMLRDPVLRSTMPVILAVRPGQVSTSPGFARAVQEAFPGKLGDKTLKSTGENVTSTYRQSGHLRCRGTCARRRVDPTPGSVTTALLFASLEGRSGHALFESEWVRLLDASPESILGEARTASARGWLELRAAGDVLDVSFRRLLETVGARS